MRKRRSFLLNFLKFVLLFSLVGSPGPPGSMMSAEVASSTGMKMRRLQRHTGSHALRDQASWTSRVICSGACSLLSITTSRQL